MDTDTQKYLYGINPMSFQFLQTGYPNNNAAVKLARECNSSKSHESISDFKSSLANKLLMAGNLQEYTVVLKQYNQKIKAYWLSPWERDMQFFSRSTLKRLFYNHN